MSMCNPLAGIHDFSRGFICSGCGISAREASMQKVFQQQFTQPSNYILQKAKELEMAREDITQHEGNKYLRRINPAIKEQVNPQRTNLPIPVDVYCVLEAFNVTCPATSHAIKKLLCAGIRGKGTRLEDLKGAMAALNRAIDMEESTTK